MFNKEGMEQLLSQVRAYCSSRGDLTDEDAFDFITELVFQSSVAESSNIGELELLCEKLFYKTRRRLGILQPLIEDSDITEIMVNGPEQIFYEKDGSVQLYPYAFDSVEELEDVMRNIAAIVHREINERKPIVDARLLDGSRVNGVYKNVAINGPILTIRKFKEQYITLEDLVEKETVPREGAELLSCLVTCGYNVFISGGTSTGKTTFLNALADFIPCDERVIVIEDSSELKLTSIENIVHLECRNSNVTGNGAVTMTDLIKSSLRMRPDRIIVGEVRGGEVLDMLQAMNTGHAGSMSTGHGNSVEGMLRRLETMYMMAAAVPVDAIRGQIAEAIDIMVHLEKDGLNQRKVIEIVEVLGYEDGKFLLNPLMTRSPNGTLEATGEKLSEKGKVLRKGNAFENRLRNLGFF